MVKGEKMNNFSRMSANKLFEYGDSDAVTERARKVGELLKKFRSESEWKRKGWITIMCSPLAIDNGRHPGLSIPIV